MKSKLPKKTDDTIDKYRDRYKDLILDITTQVSNLETGLLTFDMICGGLPKGRIIELFGHEGSGKSTLCYAMIANLQKKYKSIKAAIIDAEYSISNYEYLRDIGMDTSQVLIFSTSEGEIVFDIIEDLVKDNFNLIIIDSLASLLTKEEIEGETAMIGGFSRMISRRLKKLINVMNSSRSETVIIFTNQMRSKIQELWKGEANYTTPGGKSIKYYTSLRLEAVRDDFIKEKEKRIGSFIRIRTHKTRYFHPFSEFRVPIRYGVGYERSYDIIDILASYGCIERSTNGRITVTMSDGSKISYRSMLELSDNMKQDENIYKTLQNLLNELMNKASMKMQENVVTGEEGEDILLED